MKIKMKMKMTCYIWFVWRSDTWVEVFPCCGERVCVWNERCVGVLRAGFVMWGVCQSMYSLDGWVGGWGGRTGLEG